MTPTEAAARGWYVFPVVDRRPVTTHGHKDGTLDPAQIVDWEDQFPGCSWGLDLERSGLVVLDVDVKNGKPGVKSLEALLPELPETLCAQTPSGGFHLYYSRPAGWTPRRVIGWRPGLDLLSKGVLFVYPNDGAQIVQAPDALGVHARGGLELPLERVSRSRSAATGAELRAAERWLRAHGGAVEGQGGNAHTVQAVTRLLWDYDLTPEEAWPLLEEWNRGCEPPWGEEELAYKVEHLHEGESPRGVARLALAARPRKVPGVDLRLEDLIPAIIADSKLPWVTTPWPTLDEALGGGLPVGTLTVIAAGTGRGKTSFAAQLGAHHAKERPVVYYMGELSPQRLAARVVAQRRRLPWRDVLRGEVPEAEMRRVVAGLDFRVLPRADEPAEAIEEALDRAEGDPVMLVIDYVQLLADFAGERDLRLATTQVVRWLLRLTVDRNLVTIALAQTSRANSAHLRADLEMRPEDAVGSAAESSAFENDADNQISLRIRNDEGDAEVLVGKARLRGPGKVGMKFHGASGRWEERKIEPAADRHGRLILETLRTLNAAGVYPSKESLRLECGIKNKAGFAEALTKLGDRVTVTSRDPVLHTKLRWAGLIASPP